MNIHIEGFCIGVILCKCLLKMTFRIDTKKKDDLKICEIYFKYIKKQILIF